MKNVKERIAAIEDKLKKVVEKAVKVRELTDQNKLLETLENG